MGYPYLLIDRVEKRDEGEVVARKCVTYNEPCFQGHFRPPHPSIMPGTMLLEGMAQTAGLLLGKGKIAYLGAVERARFHRPVVPGDLVRFTARLLRRKGPVIRAEVRAEVEGELVAEATVTLVERGDVGEGS